MGNTNTWPRARNPKRFYDGSIISEVQHVPDGEWYPHSSAEDSTEKSNVALYERINSGEFGEVVELTDEEKAKHTKDVNREIQQELFHDAVVVVRSLTDLKLMDSLDKKGEETMKKWQQYGKAVNEVDISQDEPKWPKQPK